MKIVTYILALIFFAGCSRHSEIFVSPSGDDGNPGTKDKPLKSILKAQQVVRGILSEKQSGDITVWINDGFYPVPETLVFGIEDSGQEKFTVSYRSEKGENPVISGGMEITGWKKSDRGYWMAAVPGGKISFRELFIDGRRAVRARHPDNDYLRIAKVGDDRRTNFMFNTGDFPQPVNQAEIELVVLHDWSISRINLKEIDFKRTRITAVDSIGAKGLNFFNLDGWEKNPRYFLENSMAFLDSPYEWYHDRQEGMVYLILPDGQQPDKLKIFVPVTGPNLLKIEGNEKQKVRNLVFSGLTFQYCSWQIPEMGYAGIQACHFDPRPSGKSWKVVPSSVELFWAEKCQFTDCHFMNLGGSGICIGTGCNGCDISGSHFEDISGIGIMVGEGNDRLVNGDVWWKTVPEQAATDNSVLKNTVTDCGKQFYGAVGIWGGLTASTIIQENHVFNLPYTGISIGWEWSPIPTPCNNNKLIGNHIHHIMKILSDGGGIYMLGLQPGSEITGNLIHDVSVNTGRAESNGMFLDEGTTDVTVSENIIFNIAKSPLRFHKATTNLVKDNVLSCADGILPVRYNNTPEDNIKLENNIILQNSDPEHRRQIDDYVAEWKTKQWFTSEERK